MPVEPEHTQPEIAPLVTAAPAESTGVKITAPAMNALVSSVTVITPASETCTPATY